MDRRWRRLLEEYTIIIMCNGYRITHIHMLFFIIPEHIQNSEDDKFVPTVQEVLQMSFPHVSYQNYNMAEDYCIMLFTRYSLMIIIFHMFCPKMNTRYRTIVYRGLKHTISFVKEQIKRSIGLIAGRLH